MNGARWVIGVILAVAPTVAPTATAVPAMAAPAAGGGSCAAAGTRTVIEDRQARVYALGTTGRLYGCLRRNGRTTALGSSDGRRRVAGEVLAGRMVALAREAMGVDTVSGEVQVIDLASGLTLHRQAATGPVLAPESAVTVRAMVLDEHGNLAWLASQSSIVGHSIRYEIHRVTHRGAALLDAGGSIAPRSLRRHGETVVWRDGGSLRSAPLV